MPDYKRFRELNICELLFYCYFTVMLLTKGLGLTDGFLYKGALVFSSLCVLIKIILDECDLMHKICSTGLVILGAVIWRTSGYQGVLVCLMLVLSMCGMKAKEVFRYGAVVWTVTFLIQTATQLLDLRTRDFVIHNKFGMGHIIRWGLGYSHPNVLMIAYVVLVMYWFYACEWKGKNLILAYSASILGGIYLFLYSVSNTGALMLIVFLLFTGYAEFIRYRGRNYNLAEKILLQAVFPIAVLSSILLPFLLKGKAFDLLNKLLTTRPNLTRLIIGEYGIRPFGNVTDLKEAMYTLDCSYAGLLFSGGIVIFAIMCVAYLALIHYSVNSEPGWERSVGIGILMCTVIGAMSEPFAFNTSYKNLSLILLGAYYYRGQGGMLVRSVPGSRGAGKYESKALSSVRNAVITLPDVWDVFKLLARRVQIGWEKNRIRIAAVSIVAGCLAAFLYYQFADLPENIYALRSSCETNIQLDNLYLTEQEIQDLEADPENRVMNYGGPEEPMLVFSGRIMAVERIRGTVSAFVWIAGLAGVLQCILTKRRGQSVLDVEDVTET